MLSDRFAPKPVFTPEIGEGCYVVLLTDPWTTMIYAHGPFDEMSAAVAADGLRAGLDAARRPDVTVTLSRVHPPDVLAEYLDTRPRALGAGQ